MTDIVDKKLERGCQVRIIKHVLRQDHIGISSEPIGGTVSVSIVKKADIYSVVVPVKDVVVVRSHAEMLAAYERESHI